MSIDLKSKIPSWMLVDNSVKSSIFCLSMAMIVLGFMLQFIIRISYVAESDFFFPLYFLISTVMFTIGCIGVGIMTLLFLYKAVKAIRHGVFIPWITDCIQDLNEKPKVTLDQRIDDEKKKEKLESEMRVAIKNYKDFEARLTKEAPKD